MHIVVTTPTGNIGSRLAEILLDRGAELTVIARNPDKVKHLADRGANVEQGSLDDAAFLTEAMAGADAVFWLTPADFTATDFRANQQKLGDAGAQAIKANGISRVVDLSSVGAHKSSGYGAISGLHGVERAMEGAADNVTHLRAGFFMENFLMQLEPIKTMNSTFAPVRGDAGVPMIATADIAEAAANRLLDTSWTGHVVMGLHGPSDISFDRAASVMSEVLGKEIKHVVVPPEVTRENLQQMGASESAIDTMLEMYAAWDQGTFEVAEPRTPETTTPTTLAAFTEHVIKPVLGIPVGS